MRRSLPLLVLFAFVIAGCAKPEAAFIGKWQANAPAKTGNAGQDAKAASFAASISVEFKEDRTASFNLLSQSVPGTFVVSDKVATLTFKPSSGAMPAAVKPLTFKLSADGKTLAAEGNGQQMTFSKVAG